jgi:hypothetical protein
VTDTPKQRVYSHWCKAHQNSARCEYFHLAF